MKRFITDLLSLGIQGFSAFYQNRKQNKLKKGMEKLFERQDILNNRGNKAFAINAIVVELFREK